MNLGENIYRLRAERNLSQGDLADALEVSRQSVSKWENNSAVPELEKLIKMAQIFGITIDELVTGETKAEAAPPSQPTPSQAAPVNHSLPPQKLLAIILLIFGGLCLLIFTVVGVFVGLWLLGFFIALPFLLCGAICFSHSKNIGLLCGWASYLPIWLFCNYLIVQTYGFMRLLISGGLLLTGIVLVATTMKRMRRGQIVLSGWKRIHLMVAMILGLVVSCLLCLF